MAMAFHLSFNSPGPIAMILNRHWHSLTEFHRCRECGDARAIVLIACSATVVTMPSQSGEVCVNATLCPFLRCVTPSMAAVWAVFVGLWNGRSHGSINFADYESATRSGRIFMRPS